MAAASIWRSANETFRSAAAATSELPHQARKLPEVYAEYVASNAHSVGQVESTLRSLTYLLPGARLNDSEIAAESVHTFVQLLSIYHDRLLRKKAESLLVSRTPSQKAAQPKPTPHARYTMFWEDSSSFYTKIATILKIVQYTELLWEMTARRRGGERGRWRCVVLLESFKALLRMILLRLTNSRPVVTPPLPLREDFAPAQQEAEAKEEFSEEDMKLLEPMPFEPKDAFGEAGIPTPPMSDSDKISIHSNPSDPFSMPRTGFTMPTLPTPDAISNYLLEHIITPDDIKPVQQLVHRLTSIRGQAAEVMYILRPVIYALLMQRVARRYGYEGTKWRKNWAPWVAGAAIEYLARQLAKQDLESKVPGGAKSGLSALEREEFTKRGWNMAWWGMRGAFYENVTKGAITKVVDSLKGRPILDLVGGVVEDYEHLWSTYWFSTSTM
ncbi:hypothetical protein PMZ80_010742 [Knufia obscura]|uniref:Peroxisomal membrane protein PEX16 n=2 Tax=Knufia TaxID=430999 RepID=A0AAN8IJ47_9EURO|nr:hypothetical protein PMZ80_010742 [Knufia obscura]KAK5949777.1 hypothetical protein OHC33_009166 [Knufia fluminis]